MLLVSCVISSALLFAPYYGKIPYSTGLKCEVNVLRTNSYKELYESTVLYFAQLCHGYGHQVFLKQYLVNL